MREKITTLLTIVLIGCIMIGTYGKVYGQQHSANAWNVEKDNYYQWERWTHDEQRTYVLGFITGAWAMGGEIAFHSGHADLYAFTKDRIPAFTVREYIALINWLYEVEEIRDTPLYPILLRGQEFLEIRREIYEKQGR